MKENCGMPVRTESVEQQQLMTWARMMEGKYPALSMLYHIPNEGLRSRATGGRLRAEGLKSGVPDLCLPVPSGRYHGLYIELKREKGGKKSEAQIAWIEKLTAQGYCAMFCYGAEHAIKEIELYLECANDGSI